MFQCKREAPQPQRDLARKAFRSCTWGKVHQYPRTVAFVQNLQRMQLSVGSPRRRICRSAGDQDQAMLSRAQPTVPVAGGTAGYYKLFQLIGVVYDKKPPAFEA